MRKILQMVIVGAVYFLLTTSANAAGGLYLSGNLGVSMLSDTGSTFPGFENALSLFEDAYNSGDEHFNVDYKHTMSFKPGIALSLAIGGHTKKNLRFEAEVLWERNKLDSATFQYDEDLYFTSAGNTYESDYHISGRDIISGDVSCVAFMVNGYYDFKNNTAFIPFLGGGVGIAKVEYDISSNFISVYPFEYDSDYNILSIEQSGSAEALAYQLSAGVGYYANESITVDVKYRYFATKDPEFGDMTIEYATHNINFGVRFGF